MNKITDAESINKLIKQCGLSLMQLSKLTNIQMKRLKRVSDYSTSDKLYSHERDKITRLLTVYFSLPLDGQKSYSVLLKQAYFNNQTVGDVIVLGGYKHPNLIRNLVDILDEMALEGLSNER